jgi:hypothetical protein
VDFFIIIGSIAAFFVCLPFIRFIVKRISLAIILKHACKKCGAIIIPTHRLWFFGGRRGKACDLHIETEKEILSVKLFQMLRRSSSLHFNENGEYICEHCIIMLFGKFGGSCSITYKTKPKLLPYYDYSAKLPVSDKPQRKFLLINPVCSAFFIKSKEKDGKNAFADIGDTLGDTELYALKPLIRHLTEF